MVVLILMVLIRKQNLWLWNKYPTGYRFKLQLNLRSDLDPSFNQIKPSIPFKHIFSCCFFLWMKSARGAVCYYEIFTLWNDLASQRCQHWHRFYVNKHSIRNETLLRLLWVFYSWIHIRSPFFLLSHSLSLCWRRKIRVQSRTHSHAPQAWNQSLCYSFPPSVFSLMACTFWNQFRPARLKERDHFTVNNI